MSNKDLVKLKKCFIAYLNSVAFFNNFRMFLQKTQNKFLFHFRMLSYQFSYRNV